MKTLELDIEKDTITIYGIHYHLELFRKVGLSEVGSRFEIVTREDGVLTLRDWGKNPHTATFDPSTLGG